MKKVSLAALFFAATLGLSAQNALVKEVERETKSSNSNFAEALKKIAPALTDAESAGEALTWYVAGKANVGLYDQNFTKIALGQNVDKAQTGNALRQGIEYFLKALPLDKVADNKCKVKTKYTKDITKQIQNHYNDLNTAAVYCWEAKDFNGAYEAWDLYLTLPTNSELGENAPKAPADTTIAEVAYNQALAAWQGDQLEKADASFQKAIDLGYNKKNVYDYAIAVAFQLNKSDKVTKLAEAALPLYGNEDVKYLQLIINNKIENKQFDEARTMLNDAIAAEPNNPNLYFVLGILEENLENHDAALEDYRKAVGIDPSNAQYQYNVGRSLCNKAYALDDAATKQSQEEYQNVRDNQVNPLFREAATYLEEAYKLNPDEMHDALVYLRNVYYNLNDEANLKRVEAL
ncbi:MAG: tetratricopeptide repeat protein [Muribaculaceae bacterium]|nr:tetratricopeptide repeat protein [Muribaculaceae bacterium]